MSHIFQKLDNEINKRHYKYEMFSKTYWTLHYYYNGREGELQISKKKCKRYMPISNNNTNVHKKGVLLSLFGKGTKEEFS